MNLFSKSNQLFLFLVLIACQNVFAVPLTKAEAHKAMILNDHLRGVAFGLQSQPFKSEISRKSAELAVNELERLGQKDLDSSFVQDAQKWREAIATLDLLSRKKGMEESAKEQAIDAEKIAAAKSDVDKTLEAIKNAEPHKKFIIKEQKESMAINEEKTIKSAHAELELLGGDKQQLKSRAEEIKKEYEKAIIEYKQKNQQALQKQLGFAVDVSKEVKTFNKRIDGIVNAIIKKQRELKKQQPGGLSLEDILDEFNEFIIDQIKIGKNRSHVGEKPITNDEKEGINRRLFEVIQNVVTSLKGQTDEKIRAVLDVVKKESVSMIDAQFEEPAGILGFFATKEDKERKGRVDKQINAMFASLLESAQAPAEGEEGVVEQEQVAEGQDVQGADEQEVAIPSLPPKRPQQLGESKSVQKPSQPKKEAQSQEQGQSVQQPPQGQPEEPQKELSKEEQFEQMKNKFVETMDALSASETVEDREKDAEHGQEAKKILEFLVENTTLGTTIADTVKWAKELYSNAITEQNEKLSALRKRQGHDLILSKQRFEKPIDDYVATIKKKNEETQ